MMSTGMYTRESLIKIICFPGKSETKLIFHSTPLFLLMHMTLPDLPGDALQVLFNEHFPHFRKEASRLPTKPRLHCLRYKKLSCTMAFVDPQLMYTVAPTCVNGIRQCSLFKVSTLWMCSVHTVDRLSSLYMLRVLKLSTHSYTFRQFMESTLYSNNIRAIDFRRFDPHHHTRKSH